MRLPLGPGECRQCHHPLRSARRELSGSPDESAGGTGGDSYHAIRGHDAVTVPCLECHPSHITGSDASRRFISRARVEPICARCH